MHWQVWNFEFSQPLIKIWEKSARSINKTKNVEMKNKNITKVCVMMLSISYTFFLGCWILEHTLKKKIYNKYLRMGQREYQSEITSDDEGYYTVQV